MSAQESILATVAFPSHINAGKMSKKVSEDHPYLENIKKVSENSLEVKLENIADLLDLDFVNQYGALQVKINAFHILIEQNEERLENFNSQRFPEKQLPENMMMKHWSDSPEMIKQRQQVHLKMERLTSLEDEVIEEQKMRQFFSLLPSDDEEVNWTNLDEDQEEKSYETHDSETNPLEDHSSPSQKQTFWIPVVNGIAFTTVLVGGYKLLSMFFNR